MILMALCGCADSLVAPKVETSPPAIFKELWNEFDVRYATFAERHVNWDSLRLRFGSRITASTPDTDLLFAMDSLLMPLRDGHTSLSPMLRILPRSLKLYYVHSDSTRQFNQSAVSSYYLGETADLSSSGTLIFGRIHDTIGYIHIANFESFGTAWQNEIDQVLQQLWDTKAMVLDVRGNQGGSGASPEDFASRFTSESRIYSYQQERTDHIRTDLSSPLARSLEPRGECWTKPVIVLTDRVTMSAAEWFILAMKAIPNVTTVGDTSQGAFSGRLDRELSNGWLYSMSFMRISDANHICHEGIGLIPDIEVYVKENQRVVSPDTVLDRALLFLGH